jgi:dTDP-glucose pyrophosphorylase
MKALILAGGRGSRLDELSVEHNKCMIEINGRPAIEFSLDCAVGCGMSDIVVVVGYRAEEIINQYGNSYRGSRIRYVIQWEQRGLVHAIASAEDALDGEDFMLFLGDEILLNPRHNGMLKDFRESGAFAICGILTVEDRERIRRTYTLINDDNNVIYRLVEKPRTPLNDFMGTGNCVFKNEILHYIAVTPIHHDRGEKELPDLIQCAIDDGKLVKSFIICDKYTNINTRQDIEVALSFFRYDSA